MTSKAALGKRVVELRLKRGLTQKELAEPRYTAAYVSTIEAGKRQPSDDALAHLAKKLGTTVDELTTGRAPDLEPKLQLLAAEARRLISAGKREDAEVLIQQIETEAADFKLPRFAARAQELRGISSESSGKADDAASHYDRAIELLQGEPAHLRAVATAGKARALHGRGDPHQAIYLLESLREEMRREGLEEPSALVRINATLVLPYHSTGARTKAAEAAKIATSLSSQVDDPSTLATMYMAAGRMYLGEGEHLEAEVVIRKAQDVLREADLRTELGLAHVAMGIVSSRHGRLEEAQEELESAEGVLESTGSWMELLNCRCELARVHRLTGDGVRAEALLNSVLEELDGQVGFLVPWALRERAMVRLDSDPGEAERDARRALDLYEERDVLEAAVAYRVLGDALSAQGRKEDAEKAYREGLHLVESTI